MKAPAILMQVFKASPAMAMFALLLFMMGLIFANVGVDLARDAEDMGPLEVLDIRQLEAGERPTSLWVRIASARIVRNSEFVESIGNSAFAPPHDDTYVAVASVDPPQKQLVALVLRDPPFGLRPPTTDRSRPNAMTIEGIFDRTELLSEKVRSAWRQRGILVADRPIILQAEKKPRWQLHAGEESLSVGWWMSGLSAAIAGGLYLKSLRDRRRKTNPRPTVDEIELPS